MTFPIHVNLDLAVLHVRPSCLRRLLLQGSRVSPHLPTPCRLLAPSHPPLHAAPSWDPRRLLSAAYWLHDHSTA